MKNILLHESRVCHQPTWLLSFNCFPYQKPYGRSVVRGMHVYVFIEHIAVMAKPFLPLGGGGGDHKTFINSLN